MSTEQDSTTPRTPARRTTKQRVAINELLAQAQGFLSAQQLHNELRASGHSAGLATVYRTLTAMAESGEVDAIRTDDGEMVYRQCSTEAHHHHLVCRSCGRTVEIETRVVEKWIKQVSNEHGFHDVGHDLELFGLCQDC